MAITIKNILTELSFIQILAKFKDITNPEIRKLSNPLLLEYHRKCHMLYGGAIKRQPPNVSFINEIVSLHDRFVKEMLRRNMKHNSPLKKL